MTGDVERAALLDTAAEVGRARGVLAMFDAGQRDCAATVVELRAAVERIASVLARTWP